VYGIDYALVTDLRDFGLKPRKSNGLIGILTYPLLHANWKHIFDNSVTGVVLLFGLFSFYGKMGWRVIGWSWIMSGVWMWIAARDGNHIGFSGVIYALAAFIFFSGLIRKYYRLMALSAIVVFLYGSMIWGVLPIQPSISWEGHLFGAVAGVILAFYYREKGPQRPKYSWEFDDYEEVDFEADLIEQRKAWEERQKQKSPDQIGTQVRYFMKKGPPSSDSA
jgi:membrane associated rhomboid family serine protease